MSTDWSNLTVAIPAAGEMGAAIGAVLARNGVRVVTRTEGRSAQTHRRAASAGMETVDGAGLAAADIVLSIVPPGIALGTAAALAAHFGHTAPPPIYVDCNAVSPRTAQAVAAVIEAASGVFVDGSIIGAPPAGGRVPKLYVSGPEAARVAVLSSLGLDIRHLDREVGAASALKMAYGGLTKGLTGITAALMLAAVRAGVGDDLRAEMADSQPALLNRARKALPDMLPKAYRWTAEMEAVAEFMGDRSEAGIWSALGAFYDEIAKDFERGGDEVGSLQQFLSEAPR
jgi:L-threonate 2-dehydrogenase